jgi:hypothetical protein
MSAGIKFASRALLSLLLGTALVLGVPFAGNKGASYAQSVSIEFFHSSLERHGRWITVEGYGEVWRPAGISVSWQPYTVGRWGYTEFGWTWISFDAWGDIPYHYGTWTFVEGIGWVWVPGYVWAPAWVTFSYSDEFIGWAPIPPTLVISTGGFSGSVNVSANFFVFVPARSFVNVDIRGVRVPRERNVTIINQTTNVTNFTVVNNTVHNNAISVQQVEKISGNKVQHVDINVVKTKPTRIEAGAKVQGDRLAVVGPPEKGGRFEEKGKQPGQKESQPQEKGMPQTRKGQGASEQPLAPGEKKEGKIEEKGKQQSELQPQEKGMPQARKGQGASEQPLAPDKKKEGKFEDKGKQQSELQPQEKGTPQARKGPGASERALAPGERKQGAEEKGDFRGERQSQQSKEILPQARTKGERFEERGNKSSPQGPMKEQQGNGQKQKERDEKSPG